MSKQLIIKKYSNLCTVVVGDTKPVKNFLMNNGGKYNPNLWIEEKKTPGYIFNNSFEEISKLVLKVNKDFDKFCNIERTYEKNENINQEEYNNKQDFKEKDTFIFTKEKYLSLITRIEKLENDNANLLKLLINKNNTNKNNINISSENDLSEEEIDLNEDKKPIKRLI